MKTSFFHVVIFVVTFGCTLENREEAHLKKMLAYLQTNSIDSTILEQTFFNDSFRSKKNPYGAHLKGLEQLQQIVKSSQAFSTNIYEKADGRAIYEIVFAPPTEKRIYVLVTEDGIESFAPLFKGNEIVGWL